MVRHLALVLVLSLAACGVGGGDGPATNNLGGGSGTPPPTDTVAVCTATLTLTGTFTVAAGAMVTADAGCQPQGTWVVNTAIASMGTCTAVPIKPSYSYTLTGTARDTTLSYTTGTGEEFSGAVEATGGGNCEGSFDHIVADGGKFDEFNMHPELPVPTDGATTLAITGSGTYNLWNAHP